MNPGRLLQRAHVPYSGRPEYALSEDGEGTLHPGVRVENLSFPLTIGPEQAALFACLSEGLPPRRLYAGDHDGAGPRFWGREFGVDLHPLEEAGDLAELHDPLLRSVDPGSDEAVKAELKALLDRAHIPHSRFAVSALLETDNGMVSGVNIECSDWSRGLCAERIALAKALSAGLNGFLQLHIHTPDGEFSSPCGACSQVLAEHMYEGMVCLHHADGTRSDYFVRDLLPYGFHSSSLRKKGP